MKKHLLLAVALCLPQLVLAEGEGEAKEEEPTSIDSAISTMLLGCIGFQMSLFYLVNWPDHDIKRIAWQVISSCISIFVAVLLFQGFNEVIEDYVIEGGSEIWEVCIDIAQMLFWLSCMQLMLAITSGAINELWGGHSPPMREVEVNVKSLAKLLSHITGFSAINAFGSVQQTYLSRSPMFALIIVPIGLTCLFVMYHGYDIVREKVSLSDDNEIDEYELKWDEETEDSENDVAGLSLSFLTVQALRFAIGGTLPNVEGLEAHASGTSHDFHQWGALLLCGVVFGILDTIAIKHEVFLGKSGERTERLWQIIRNYFTFGSAWCSFYGVMWAFSHTPLGEQKAMLQVIVALAVSGIAFISVFVMDKVLDHDVFGEDSHTAHHILDEIILATCVLVGFSWEQSFDNAVSVVANSSLKNHMPSAVIKLGMSLFLVAIVFPAWRFFILPKELELAEEADSEEGLRLHRLKAAARQHYKLMVEADTDDHILDRAHLKMKQERWHCHRAHQHSSYVPDGLVHLQVTSMGIHEVDRPRAHHSGRKRTRHLRQSDTTINLLA